MADKPSATGSTSSPQQAEVSRSQIHVRADALRHEGAGGDWHAYKQMSTTETFRVFAVHYDFDFRLCNPESGHEKSNVQRLCASVYSRSISLQHYQAIHEH